MQMDDFGPQTVSFAGGVWGCDPTEVGVRVTLRREEALERIEILFFRSSRPLLVRLFGTNFALPYDMDVNRTEATTLRDSDARTADAAERNRVLQAHAEALEEAQQASSRPWPTFFSKG